MRTPAILPRDLFASDEYRIEGRDKVSGQMKYTADFQRPKTLWAAYVTSPYASAKVLAVDASAARAVEGVRAVITGKELGIKRWGRNLYDIPVLAVDEVLFMGERVAAVAAETREIAEAAAALIEVEYEERTPILEPAEALASGAPVFHPDRASYFFRSYDKKEHPKQPHPNIQGTNRFRKGADDLEPLFAGAKYVFEHTFESPRQHCGYIEPHSTMVWIEGDGTVYVQSPNKSPFVLRDQLARVAEIPKEKIVVEPSAIGGDFGGKGVTVDEFPCYFLAKETGRPVKYVQTYSEELQIAATRHPSTITLKTAVGSDGKFIAHRSDVVYNGGAYAGGKPGPLLLPGSGYTTVGYNTPNVDLAIKAVYTNTPPGAHVRAPTAPQLFWAWEQHVDMIARELEIDPIELRLRNVVREGETSVTKEGMADPMAAAVLERLRDELSKRTSANPPGRGLGIALACWHTGGGKTGVKMTLSAEGTIDVLVGTPDQGAGAYTVVRRVAAATLSIDPARISVRRGTTSDSPNDPGAGASRVTHVLGGAAEAGALKLRELLEERSGLRLQDDRFFDEAGRAETFEAVARRLCNGEPVTVSAEYDGTHSGPDHLGDFSFVATAVEVEVDRETGTFTIVDALLIADVAKIINPVAHQGQINGGFIYGLGQSLFEEMAVDESGKMTYANLGEYKLPTMMDAPPLRTVLVQAPLTDGPYGAKGAGELSNSGVAPAVMNAIHDAVGVRLFRFPITAERVYDALQST